MADYSTRRGGLRAKLPLQVLSGFYPTEPVKLSSLAPAANVNDIKSGMAIVKTSGEWVRAQAADATGSKSIYIALHDADSLDVQAAEGKLVGLDCSDSFELQTGYFDSTEVWAEGDQLTVGANGILVKFDAANFTSGDVVKIVGEITKVGDVTSSNAIAYVGYTPSTTAANATLIQFKTVDRTGTGTAES